MRTIIVGGRTRGWREVSFGVVLVPTLNPVNFVRKFVFDHGQFGARRESNIGMEPEVLPPEKVWGPSYALVKVVVAVRTLTRSGLSRTDGLLGRGGVNLMSWFMRPGTHQEKKIKTTRLINEGEELMLFL